jgi:hypothetical protein
MINGKKVDLTKQEKRLSALETHKKFWNINELNISHKSHGTLHLEEGSLCLTLAGWAHRRHRGPQIKIYQNGRKAGGMLTQNISHYACKNKQKRLLYAVLSPTTNPPPSAIHSHNRHLPSSLLVFIFNSVWKVEVLPLLDSRSLGWETVLWCMNKSSKLYV